MNDPTNPTSAERLTAEEREWLRLADAATPGPWCPDEFGGIEAGSLGPVVTSHVEDEDRAFMCASRRAVPSLAAALAAAREEIERLRGFVRGFRVAIGHRRLGPSLRPAGWMEAEAALMQASEGHP